MNKIAKWCSLAALATMGVIAAPQDAKASGTGYVCNVSFTPFSSGLGTKGSLWVNLYSGPNCTGTFMEQAQYCSVGATDTASCDNVLYDGPQLIAMWENLQRAAAADQKIYVQSTTNSWHVRGLYVQFYSN